MKRPDDWIRSSVRDLRAVEYPPPAEGLLRLDANTNLIGTNPVLERVLRGPLPDLAQYPSPFSETLRDALASEHGVERDGIVVGNGSDEILDYLTKAFLNPGDIVAVLSPSFVMYPFYGRVNLGRVVEIPLDPEFDLDENRMLSTRAKLTFLASPNNPTGNAFDPAVIERLIQESGSLVVVDEAYAHFCDQDFASKVREFENLVVLRTFSKAYGLAGLRVGYAIAPPEISRVLSSVKPPFTVGTIPELVAREALRDRAFLDRSVAAVRRERVRLAEEASRIGIRPRRCDANFLLLDLGRPFRDVSESLRSRGILVRDMGGFRGLENHIRVTVGLPEHTDRLIAALRDLLA